MSSKEGEEVLGTRLVCRVEGQVAGSNVYFPNCTNHKFTVMKHISEIYCHETYK